MPNTPDAYTHRIGRTGRAEREGRAYTLVGAEDAAMIRAVEARIDASIPRRSFDGFDAGPLVCGQSDGKRGREKSRGSRRQGVASRPGRRRRRRSA